MLDRIAHFVLFFALIAITAVLYPFPPSLTKLGLTAGFIFVLVFPILLASALSWLLRASMIWFIFEAFSLDLPLMATPLVLIVLNLVERVQSTAGMEACPESARCGPEGISIQVFRSACRMIY